MESDLLNATNTWNSLYLESQLMKLAVLFNT